MDLKIDDCDIIHNLFAGSMYVLRSEHFIFIVADYSMDLLDCIFTCRLTTDFLLVIHFRGTAVQ